jgi:hypothetical protein
VFPLCEPAPALGGGEFRLGEGQAAHIAKLSPSLAARWPQLFIAAPVAIAFGKNSAELDSTDELVVRTRPADESIYSDIPAARLPDSTSHSASASRATSQSDMVGADRAEDQHAADLADDYIAFMK